MRELLSVLKKYFGHNEFRKDQEEIINSLIAGENRSIIMHTGGGKSLCYQIPSLVRDGVGVIISPLIALMDDQVNALKQNGIKAVYINSTLTSYEKTEIIKQVENNKIDLMYVSPELLLSPKFYNWLKKIKIALFAIDESHCVSQWGHDFRKEYNLLYLLKNDFSDIPRIALTATANEVTRNEIREIIGIEKKNEFISGFDRPNIRYQIQEKIIEDEYDQLLDYIEDNHQGNTGIVYCISRKRTEDISRFLKSKGKNATYYHGRLSSEDRRKVLKRFSTENDIIIVATIAFGMGIDKPNVRFVCHMDLPSSIEAYYQETGRAGRDGKHSDAWMLYGVEDVFKREGLINSSTAADIYKNIEKNNLDTMFTLCEMPRCRRQMLLGYFGESLETKCNNCDNCLAPKPTTDATIIAQKALSTIMRTKQSFGLSYLIDVLLGNETAKVKRNKHNDLSVFGIGSELKRENWKVLFRQLIVLGYIQINPNMNTLWLTKKSLKVLKEGEKIQLSQSVTKNRLIYRAMPKDLKKYLTFEDQKLLIELKRVRMDISRTRKIPAYLVFNDETLTQILLKKPKTVSSFQRIDGIGTQKSYDFGERIVNLIKESVY